MIVSRPTLKVKPASTPVSVAEVKDHAVITFDSDDLYLETLLEAAVSRLDGINGLLGRCLISQTWSVSASDWKNGGCLRLPYPDVSELEVKYLNSVGAEATLPSGAFDFGTDDIGGYLLFDADFSLPEFYGDVRWPITLEFTAGYGDESDVPDELKLFIKQLVAHWYENRDSPDVPPAIDALLTSHKWMEV